MRPGPEVKQAAELSAITIARVGEQQNTAEIDPSCCDSDLPDVPAGKRRRSPRGAQQAQ